MSPLPAVASERDVETKIVYPLFHDTLGYPEEDLQTDVAVAIKFGRQKLTKKADLVVCHRGQPVIVVEAKKPTETLQAGVDQVDSYAFALQTPYSVVTNGRGFILRGYYSFNSRINILEESVDQLQQDGWRKLQELISFANVRAASADQENQPQAVSPEKIRDYRRFFRGLHNVIRDGDKLDPAAAFDEMSKILFLKVAEEDWMRQHGGQTVLAPEKIAEWEKMGTWWSRESMD